MRTETGHVVRLENYKQTDFEVTHVDLTFRLDPDSTIVKSRLSLKRRPGAKPGAPLVLAGDELHFKGLRIDDVDAAPKRYKVTAQRLEIRDLPTSDAFTVDVTTAIAPSQNTKLMGLYRSNAVYCTQCEAEGFRRITYFLDRPDVLAMALCCVA